jgi:hypothetical protein
MMARALLAALCTLHVNLGCVGVQDKTPCIIAARVDDCPLCAKAHFVRRSQKILVGQESVYPEGFCLSLDRGNLASVQTNHILCGRNRDTVICCQQSSGSKLELQIGRFFGQNIMYVCCYSAPNQFSSRSANIFEGDCWSYGVWRNPSDETRYAGTVHQIHSQERNNWQLDADSRFSVERGSFRRNPRGFVGTEKEITLTGGNGNQEEREDSQYESVESNRVFPRPIPDYRQPLPEGFGWLMLIAGGIGGGIGGVYVLLLVWLTNRDEAAAQGKAHNRPEQRPK